MNEYGMMARDHWREHLPARYAQIEDPGTWFTQLGAGIGELVPGLVEDLRHRAPPGPPGQERLLARLGGPALVLDAAQCPDRRDVGHDAGDLP